MSHLPIFNVYTRGAFDPPPAPSPGLVTVLWRLELWAAAAAAAASELLLELWAAAAPAAAASTSGEAAGVNVIIGGRLLT